MKPNWWVANLPVTNTCPHNNTRQLIMCKRELQSYGRPTLKQKSFDKFLGPRHHNLVFHPWAFRSWKAEVTRPIRWIHDDPASQLCRLVQIMTIPGRQLPNPRLLTTRLLWWESVGLESSLHEAKHLIHYGHTTLVCDYRVITDRVQKILPIIITIEWCLRTTRQQLTLHVFVNLLAAIKFRVMSQNKRIIVPYHLCFLTFSFFRTTHSNTQSRTNKNLTLQNHVFKY